MKVERCVRFKGQARRKVFGVEGTAHRRTRSRVIDRLSWLSFCVNPTRSQNSDTCSNTRLDITGKACFR